MPGVCNGGSTCTVVVAGLLIVLGILSGVVKYVWILDIVVCVVLFFYFCCAHSVSRAVRAGELHRQPSSPPPPPPPGAVPLSSAAAAIPAFVYETTPGEGGAEASCSVCLEGVKGGETVRKMPICGHMFHVDCIDMWLGSHSTCPNCRSTVVTPPEEGRTGNVSETPAPPRPPV